MNIAAIACVHRESAVGLIRTSPPGQQKLGSRTSPISWGVQGMHVIRSIYVVLLGVDQNLAESFRTRIGNLQELIPSMVR